MGPRPSKEKPNTNIRDLVDVVVRLDKVFQTTFNIGANSERRRVCPRSQPRRPLPLFPSNVTSSRLSLDKSNGIVTVTLRAG